MTMSEVHYVSLDQIAPGAHVIVRALRADRELNGRFMLLGLVVGAAAEMLQNRSDGPVLIRTGGALLAIGRDEAHKILVEIAP